MKLASYVALGAVSLLTVLSTGCGNSENEAPVTGGAPAADGAPAATASASTLPGAADVMAALDAQNYDGAMSALVKVRQTVTTADQQVQFTVLAHEVKMRLMDASASDPKAAQALTALRMMTVGR